MVNVLIGLMGFIAAQAIEKHASSSNWLKFTFIAAQAIEKNTRATATHARKFIAAQAIEKAFLSAR